MRSGIIINLVLLMLVGSCGARDMPELPPAEKAAFQKLLLDHARRYPRARAEDYYKMISQSVFGVGHLIEDETSTRSYLLRDLSTLGFPSPDEQLLEPIDPDSMMVRVNLRPFAAQNLPADALLGAMMETAAAVEPDTSLFLGRWNAFRDIVKQHRVNVPTEDFKEVDRYARERNYPPLHHSDAYRGAYKPAYRVVLKELFLEKL